MIAQNSYAPVKGRLTPARLPYAHAVNHEQHTMRAMLLVAVLHIIAIFLMLHPFTPAPSEQPVLSFTVTMMDVSSSKNTISSAASSASTPVAKPEPKKKADEKIIPVPTPKTKAPLSHNSEERTAVLAPTTPAAFDAAYLHNPAPAYPALSRRMGEQGNILLSVYVGENGQAQTVQLKKSSGFDRLDNAALETVKRWRFAAAKHQEQLIASWVQVPIKFILE